MDIWTMVVLIVLVASVASVAGQYLKTRERERAELDGDARRELDDLKTRVEVLERIVTDQKGDLSRKIDQL